LGNTKLQPETSREFEGGFDASLWNNRLSLIYTRYNKTRYNAIVSIPVAASVYGDNENINFNIGEVRNTGMELSLDAQVLQNRSFSWRVGGNISNDNNVLVRLNSGAQFFLGFTDEQLSGRGLTSIVNRNVTGYPLFGQWALPIVSYVDENNDGIIEKREIRFGDSLVYVGQSDPKYQMNINTSVSLGRLSVYATFAYQNGMTQNNDAALNSGAFDRFGNAPGTTLADQAAIVAATFDPSTVLSEFWGNGNLQRSSIGLLQTVNMFRFNALSINYTVPKSVSTLFRVPGMSVALQGSNLGLHTNYRGKDPNVNAFSTGNSTRDGGQLPQPRTWQLKFNLGN